MIGTIISRLVRQLLLLAQSGIRNQKIANSYAEPAYARPRLKTDLSFTKVTLVFCVGLRPTFCSFILNLNQAEQKKLRVKFLFVMCCVFAQTRVCRLKSEDPHHGLDSNYVEVVLGCDKNFLASQRFQFNMCTNTLYYFSNKFEIDTGKFAAQLSSGLG